MNKALYITNTAAGGDSFDICVTFDHAEATEAARMEYQHLTEKERKGSTISVESYIIELAEDDTRDAKTLYHDLLEEDDDQLYNASTYEEYQPEWTHAELEDIAKALETEGRTPADDIDLTKYQRPDRQSMTDADKAYIIERLGYHSDYRTQPRNTNASPISKARLAKGLTQAQLAKAIGVQPSQIGAWEQGTRRPKLEALKKLAEALGAEWEELV